MDPQVLLMRHAAMLIGQTGGGKSVILNTLAMAQTRMGRRTMLHVLDSKAIHPEDPLLALPCTGDTLHSRVCLCHCYGRQRALD